MRAIVFAMNGCPAGWLGAYGNDWVGTPNLDRLAAEGVTFDRHISNCPEPTAARRAWLGKEPPPQPPLCREGEFAGSPSLQRGGWGGGLSILVRANHPDTDGPAWFYAGWGEVFDARPRAEDASPLDELLRRFPALLDRLVSVPDFLLWIETDRLIPPWDVQQDVFEAYLEDVEDEELAVDEGEESRESDGDEPIDEQTEAFIEEVEDDDPDTNDSSPLEEEPVPPFADPPTGPFDRADLDAWDWLHRTFAAVITKLDAELGHLFTDLRARGLDRSAAWLITSDFGHPLGEHGQIGLHRPWLHEELVHLPLILRLPDGEQAGRRVAGFTQPPDIYPTLLSLLGLRPPPGATGLNLLPLARGETQSVREVAMTALELGGTTELALRTEDWALLVPIRVPEGDPPREPHLFGKPDDRWEVNDLRPSNIERADELEAQLREEIQKTGSPQKSTKSTTENQDQQE